MKSLLLVFAFVALATPVSAQVTGRVIDGTTGAPLANVALAVHQGDAQARSDAYGEFAIEVGEGLHFVRATREGYLGGGYDRARAGDVIELELFPAEHTEEGEAAWLARRVQPDPHAPMFRPLAIEPVDGEGSVTLAATAPELPETIRVWRARGTPDAPMRANGFADRSCSGRVDVLPFEEYVKGVVPSEWIPSWHQESLRSGAIAARSYAFRHLSRGGRWDCADVDDGSVTQVYKDNRSDGATAAVEHTRGQVVMRDGAVVFAEYSAENGHPTRDDVADPVCRGESLFGHGRGMCQTGSHRWASGRCATDPCDYEGIDPAPKDYRWIVEHYFPGGEVAGGDADTPCLVLGPEGGVLDDEGPCFSSFGPARFWRSETRGHEGSLKWTNAFDGDSPSNWARWSVFLEEPGRYTIEVFVEPDFAVYNAVRYEVEHADGVTESIVDQATEAGWVKLGEFELGESAEVRLLDNYEGEIARDQKIVADAVRITPAAGMVVPDAGTDDAGMDDAGVADTGTDATREGGEDEGGCGCHIATPSDASGVLLLVLVFVFRRARLRA